MSSSGDPFLCDFGLSSVVQELFGTSYFTTNIGGAVRWAAPELYCLGSSDDGSVGGGTEEPLPQPTPASDVYSFGSVSLEVGFSLLSNVSLWR